MTYNEAKNSFSRTKVWYVVITLDFCANTFGVAPCTAIGTACFNTYATCKDRANYNKSTKDYTFSSIDCPLPFNNGERPYILKVQPAPTEITNAMPVVGRVSVALQDEPCSDYGLDPYASTRASEAGGTYFSRLLARNPNFKGRAIKIYEGFDGIAFSEFQQRFAGTLDNMKLSIRGVVTIDGIDYIGDLKAIKLPYKYDIKVSGSYTTADTTFVFAGGDVQRLAGASTASTYYLRIGEEVLSYTGAQFSTATNTISGLTRGVGNSEIKTYSNDSKVTFVHYYSPMNAFDRLKLLWTSPVTADEPGAGLSTVYLNATAFDYWRDFYTSTNDINVEAFIENPISMNDIIWDLVDLMHSKVWIGEDLKFTISRIVPNCPGRTYQVWSDTASIILDSDNVDGNDASRYTRQSLLWNLRNGGKMSEDNDYERLKVYIDPTLESSVYYDDMNEKRARTLWLRTGNEGDDRLDDFTNWMLQRKLVDYGRASQIINVSVEMKDGDVKTGEFVKLNTDMIVNPDGSNLSYSPFQVLKRDAQGPQINYTLQRLRDTRVAYISPDTSTFSSVYTDALLSEKEYGWIAAADSASSTDAVMTDGTPAYTVF